MTKTECRVIRIVSVNIGSALVKHRLAGLVLNISYNIG